MLDLQKIAQLKRKRKLITGAEFITFDNTANAMVRIIPKCLLLKTFLLPADYRAEITVLRGPLVSPAVAVCGWCKLTSDLDPHTC